MMFQTLSLPKLFRAIIRLLFSIISDDGEKQRAMRKVFVPQKDEIAWDWRKIHRQELRDLLSSTNIIRVENVRERRGACGI